MVPRFPLQILWSHKPWKRLRNSSISAQSYRLTHTSQHEAEATQSPLRGKQGCTGPQHACWEVWKEARAEDTSEKGWGVSPSERRLLGATPFSGQSRGLGTQKHVGKIH